MKTTNEALIKKLAELGVLETEPLKYHKAFDIIIKNDAGIARRVITDYIQDEDLPLMIATEQLRIIKNIYRIIKTTFVLSLASVAIWLLTVFFEFVSPIV